MPGLPTTPSSWPAPSRAARPGLPAATAGVAVVLAAALAIGLATAASVGAVGASPKRAGARAPAGTRTRAVGSPRAASSARAAPNTITAPEGVGTLLGTGRPGFSGDGGPAPGASLAAPSGIALDAWGDLFIADTGNCRVREVPARTGVSFGRFVRAGTVVTLAGGSCHDHSHPPPGPVATDPAGDVFVDYPTANRVAVLAARRSTLLGTVAAAGHLATVVGTGAPGFGGDGGRAAGAELDDPGGIAVAPDGDLYVADTANCRVRVVAAFAGVHDGIVLAAGDIATVAGNGVCGSSGDGGPAAGAQVWDPGALATDPAGDLFVADQGNRTVRVLAPRTATVLGVAVGAGDLTTVAGEGSYGPYVGDGLPAAGPVGELDFPSGMAVDAAGDLVVGDGASQAVREVTAGPRRVGAQTVAAGDMVTVGGALPTGPGHTGTTWVGTPMLDPVGVAVTPGGAVVYADRGADVVRVLPPVS